jgi:ABC-type nitrate/sulfonate/bicarbonate transport system substrate-binding protein
LPKTAQAPAALQRFKVVVNCNPGAVPTWISIDAGKDKGIWAKHGLDPEFICQSRAVLASDIREHVASGISFGTIIPSEVLLARSEGVPVKIVAGYVGKDAATSVFVKSDGSINTVKDLDGKKVGVYRPDHFTYRHLSYLSDKFAIRPEAVSLGNLTNMVVALKLGKIDAFISPDPAALRLVDSGELRILLHFSEILSKEWVSVGLFATDM